MLDQLLRTAVTGESVSVNELNTLMGSYLTELSSDMDMVMEIAASAAQQRSISEHCLNVALLSMALGLELGLKDDDLRSLGTTALVHDWGLLKVPGRILNSKQRWTLSEELEVQKHSMYSLEILKNISGLPGIVPLLSYQMHERPDGSGYPRARQADKIHPLAKILRVADDYMTLVTARPWRPRYKAYSAMVEVLKRASKGKLDPTAVRALLNVQSMFPIGSLSRLNDGRIVRTIRRNGEDYYNPIVEVIKTGDGPVEVDENERIIDLSRAELSIEYPISPPGIDEIEAEELD